MAPPRRKGQKSLANFLGGATSGCVSTLLLQPLDVVKTRMQMSKAFNRTVHLRQALSIQSNTGVFNTMRTIVQQDSLAGLWRGVLPTFIRNSLGVGIYFVTLNKLTTMASNSDGKMSSQAALLAGAFSRSFAVCLLCPLSVVKTRMETIEYSTKYTGIGNALGTIARKEGPRGLFSGLVPAIVRDAPYSALYMVLYLRAKERIGRAVGITDNRSNISRPTTSPSTSPPVSDPRVATAVSTTGRSVMPAPSLPVTAAPATEPAAPAGPKGTDKVLMMSINFVSGAFGGGLATLLTQPQDVIKTRMQLTQRRLGHASRYGTVREAARRIFAEEGVYGFFRGSSARILKRMLGSAITWMIFEETVVRYDRLLRDRGKDKQGVAGERPH